MTIDLANISGQKFSSHNTTNVVSEHQDLKNFCVAVHALAAQRFVDHRKYPKFRQGLDSLSSPPARVRTALSQICCSQSLQVSCTSDPGLISRTKTVKAQHTFWPISLPLVARLY